MTRTVWRIAGEREVSIRTMRMADIPAAMRLKQAARWNQTFADWRRFLGLEPAGCFVAVCSGRVIATVTTCSFAMTAQPTVGWIGMMLVDPAMRRQGIATRLMRYALDKLDAAGCSRVCLDATPAGAAVYRKLGFQEEREVTRFGGVSQAPNGWRQWTRMRRFCWRDWPELLALDQLAAGAVRAKLLKRLLVERSEGERVFCEGGGLQGFVIERSGSRAVQIGPLVARRQEAGEILLKDALARHRNQQVLVDVPAENDSACAIVRRAGLTAERQFLRMARGGAFGGQWSYLWASSGPEKG